eukprot:9481329-Pyramimonas_sp.AAC.1
MIFPLLDLLPPLLLVLRSMRWRSQRRPLGCRWRAGPSAGAAPRHPCCRELLAGLAAGTRTHTSIYI